MIEFDLLTDLIGCIKKERGQIMKMFPSVMTYIVGTKNGKSALKVFLKDNDSKAENYFCQAFNTNVTQFVNVTKRMEANIQKPPPIKSQPLIEQEIRKSLREVIKRQSTALMANHSHIIRISTDTEPVGMLVGKPCIVIHCLDKSIVPIGEQELPKELEDYPIYIKEGFIMFGFCDGCETLKNGCSIGIPSDESAGSIGFFVKLRKPDQMEEEAGFLTAAHVALPYFNDFYTEGKLFTEHHLANPNEYEIVHPSSQDSDSVRKIGKVSEAFCGTYGQKSIGIDAAFVNIYNQNTGNSIHIYTYSLIF